MVRLMRDAKKQMVTDWNEKYRIGQKVSVKKDAGTTVETTTSSTAVLLGDHTPVIQLSGISGCYALDRVTPITKKECPPHDLVDKGDFFKCNTCGKIFSVEDVLGD